MIYKLYYITTHFVIIVVLIMCTACKNNYDDKINALDCFLSKDTCSLTGASSFVVSRIIAVTPEESCILYITDIGCSHCIMQIADDALELKNLGSSLNIWIIPISEEPPYLIEYFLFEKKDENNLGDLPFRITVLDNIVLSDVSKGLYKINNGEILSFLPR